MNDLIQLGLERVDQVEAAITGAEQRLLDMLDDLELDLELDLDLTDDEKHQCDNCGEQV